MFNTALHREMLHGMKDYGFDVTVNGFDWKYENVILLLYIIIKFHFSLLFFGSFKTT